MKLAVAVGLAMTFGNAYAFHEGGVAYCDGCHTMHASEGNTVMARSTKSLITQYNAGPYLLQGRTQSAACLNCHEGALNKTGSYYVSSAGVGALKNYAAGDPLPLQLSPGGDFSWLKYGYSWTSPRSGTEAGSRHGHSVIAPDFGYNVETGMAGNTAPGSTYPVGQLHCSSCHDPHGKYRRTTAVGGQGNYSTSGAPIYASGSYGEEPAFGYAVGAYRLLAGNGYKPVSLSAAGVDFSFVADPPSVTAPSSYNRSEALTQTRVSYGAGMSEWCANCHASIHNASANIDTTLRHPTGANAKLAGTAHGVAFNFANNYNSYVKTGDLSGAQATSFLSLVQFDLGTDDYAVINPLAVNDGSQTSGVTGSMNVNCMSCHRAHATAFQSMTRWDNKTEFLTVDEDGTGPKYADQWASGGAEGAEARGKDARAIRQAYYDLPPTTFSGWQRSLCNKCHVKD